MIKERSISIGIVAIFLLGAVAVMPTASAQGEPNFKFTIGGLPNGPVNPLQTFTVDVDYEYTLRVPVQNLGGAIGTPTVELTVNCDPAITVAGATRDVIALQSTSQTVVYEGTIPLQLTVDRTAPALRSLTCEVSGSVTEVQAQTIPATDTWENSFTVQSAYFSLLEAKTDLKLKQGGPQKQIPFSLEVTNFGNGQTQVFFELKEKPSGKWQGLVPDLLLLDEKDGERSSSTVTFTVVTPFKNGWNNEEGAFTVGLKPVFTVDTTEEGQEVLVTLVARVRGVYVPTLEPLVMVGAVVGSALVARLTREE